MRHLLAKLELEGISIFSFKAVTGCLTEKIGLFPRRGRSAKFRTSQTDLRTKFVCLHMHTKIPVRTHTHTRRQQARARARSHKHTGALMSVGSC